MSFSAEIEFESVKMPVLKCHYLFNQPIDPVSHRVSGKMRGGTIDLEFQTQPNIILVMQRINKNSVILKGTINFYNRATEQSQMKIEFKNARVIRVENFFDNEGKYPMIDRITLTCETLTYSFDGKTVEIENSWDHDA